MFEELECEVEMQPNSSTIAISHICFTSLAKTACRYKSQTSLDSRAVRLFETHVVLSRLQLICVHHEFASSFVRYVLPKRNPNFQYLRLIARIGVHYPLGK
jgi:hypothetical protein